MLKWPRLIEIGKFADDGTGDPFRLAAEKINDNFLGLYEAFVDNKGFSDVAEAAAAESQRFAGAAEFEANNASVSAGAAAAFVGGFMYETTAAGLAGTAEGKFFAVRGENASIVARLYQKKAGVAVEQTYLAGGLSLAMAGQRADKGRVFDVTDYGAVGDGITNDSPAFKLANRMCALAGGGTVFVPKTSAFYLMADPHRVLGTIGGGPNDPPFNRGIISLLPGVSWAGDGAEIRLSGGRTYVGSLFYQDFYDAGSPDIDDISFTGLFLNGNIEAQIQPYYPKSTTDDTRVWQHGHAIAVYRGQGLKVTGCKFKGWWGNGVQIQTEPFPAYTDLKTIPQVSVNCSVMFCEFVDIFGIGVCGCNTQAIEIAFCYFHGDGYWVGAITPEVAYEDGVMMDWNIHDNVFDFRDGKLPIESALAFTSSTDPAGQQYRKHTRRALCAILAYNQYSDSNYNEHLRGIRFTDNTVYQGIVQIYNFAGVDVSRNRFHNTYEDLSGLYLINGTTIEIGSYSGTNGLRDARVIDNTIESALDGYGINIMRTDDVLVTGNLVNGTRQQGIRLAAVSGSVVHNRIINVGIPITAAEFAANPSLSCGVVVYGSLLRPLNIHHNEVIENRTGAGQAIRHGVVVNTGVSPASAVYAHFNASVGNLGDPVKDTGGDGGGPVRAFGNTKNGDDTIRFNRGFAAASISTTGDAGIGGVGRARSVEVRAIAGERATESWFVDTDLICQINAFADGSIAMQAFSVAAGSKGTLRSNPWAVDPVGRFKPASTWNMPVVLGDLMYLWVFEQQVYVKWGSAPTAGTDGSVLSQTVAAPASATATGLKGQEAHDADFLYRCVADNQWKRTPLSSW